MASACCLEMAAIDEDSSLLPQAPECYKGKCLLHLRNGRDHTVFFAIKNHVRDNESLLLDPHPRPQNLRESWDDNHVKLPTHFDCTMTRPNDTAQTTKWRLINNALRNPISDFRQLQDAILSYNDQGCRRSWNFRCLETFFNQNSAIKMRFFSNDGVLIEMQKLALLLPELITQPIPFLMSGVDRRLTMTQQQIACLLANAFFCTFPERCEDVERQGERYSKVNFNSLFNERSNPGNKEMKVKTEKIRCLLHYFERVCTEMPNGVITFTRQVLQGLVKLNTVRDTEFSALKIQLDGKIEDYGTGMLQVVFANKNVGGSVLDKGCGQEQIRIFICPEIFVARLFTPTMKDRESLIVSGCERFSNYKGFSSMFEWHDNHVDRVKRDAWGRKHTKVVFMDALKARNKREQFQENQVEREFNKAYSAFKNDIPEYTPTENSHLPAVCTGHWGCGFHNGNREIKAVIQLMAASYAKRDVCHLAFRDNGFSRKLKDIHENLNSSGTTLGRMSEIIQSYARDQGPSFFDYALRSLRTASLQLGNVA